MLPNVIIAGTNKAGTTSLFRYLSDHPDINPSRTKELRFFSAHEGPISDADLEEYEQNFSAYSGQRFCLEASPDYLSGGRRIAERIRATLPDVRLIFILREPASRLLSAYRKRARRNDARHARIDVDEYIDELLDNRRQAGGEIAQRTKLGQEVDSVCYARLLQPYLELFPAGHIYVSFFDDLEADSERFVASICQFLEIDDTFYRGYGFEVENRTRPVRSRGMQRIAHETNMFFEPALNRYPAMRRFLRSVYHSVNESPSGFNDGTLRHNETLRTSFKADNDSLRALLTRSFPGIVMPGWLTDD